MDVVGDKRDRLAGGGRRKSCLRWNSFWHKSSPTPHTYHISSISAPQTKLIRDINSAALICNSIHIIQVNCYQYSTLIFNFHFIPSFIILHCISHFISFHFISLHFILFHFVSLYFVSLFINHWLLDNLTPSPCYSFCCFLFSFFRSSYQSQTLGSPHNTPSRTVSYGQRHNKSRCISV